MKEGNEPTRWRGLICICLKWQVREREKGCSSPIKTFSPSAEDEGTEELRAALLCETLEWADVFLPAQAAPPLRLPAEGKLQGGPSERCNGNPEARKLSLSCFKPLQVAWL